MVAFLDTKNELLEIKKTIPITTALKKKNTSNKFNQVSKRPVLQNDKTLKKETVEEDKWKHILCSRLGMINYPKQSIAIPLKITAFFAE